jgi:hypothetical protein
VRLAEGDRALREATRRPPRQASPAMDARSGARSRTVDGLRNGPGAAPPSHAPARHGSGHEGMPRRHHASSGAR